MHGGEGGKNIPAKAPAGAKAGGQAVFLAVFFPSVQLLWTELTSVLATGLGR